MTDKRTITVTVNGTKHTKEVPVRATDVEAMADIHTSADYRQHLTAMLSRYALEKAAGLADNAPWNRAH